MTMRLARRAAALLTGLALLGAGAHTYAGQQKQSAEAKRPPKSDPIPPQAKPDAPEEARKPPKPRPIGPAQLPGIEKTASITDEGSTKEAIASTPAKAPAKPSSGKPVPLVFVPAANLDAVQSTRLEGCLTAGDAGGWMLTNPAASANQKAVMLVGDEDVAHHAGEYVQVKGAYVAERNASEKPGTASGSTKAFDVDGIEVLAPNCPPPK